MATAKFFNTSKRHNSTLVPSGGIDIAVNLKGGADLNAPLFVLNSESIPTYSMMLFEGKYYFINKIRNVRDKLYEIECSVDVLATYKANIQDMSAHVLYYTHSNSEIVDRRLSAKTTNSIDSATGNFDVFGSVTSTTCAYILTVIGKDGSCAYAVNGDDLNGLLSQSFFDSLDNNLDDIEPISGEGWDKFADGFRWFIDMLKTEIGSFTYSDNASANVKSCFILPLTVSSVGGSSQHIYLGRMDSGKTGLRISDRIFSDSATVSIPWQADDWRRNGPYHEIFLYIPFIGLTQLSASDLIGETSITVSISLDKFSGDTIIKVSAGSKELAYYTTNLSSPYAIGSSNITPMSTALAIGSAAGAVATSTNPALSAAMVGLGLVNDITPTVSSIGTNSGGAMIGLNGNQIKCFTIFHDTTVGVHSVSDVIGEPYNGILSLENISGYVQTVNASVSGSMTDDERNEINDLLDGGVYIE